MNVISRCLLAVLGLLTVFSAQPAFAGTPHKVAILLFDDVQIIDFAAPYEVFGQAGYEVYTVSKEGKTVTTAMGLSVSPDYSFANVPQVDSILVPGGDTRVVMNDVAVQRWLRGKQGDAEHILSVCTGAHILAQSGLLDGKEATTYRGALDDFERDYQKVTVKRAQRFVDNGQIITSAGLSSGIDAALHLVSKVSGIEQAKTVAMHIEYDWDPEGGFVRAMMADRLYPDNQYTWPEGIEFDRLYSFGDEKQWAIAYTVKTDASASTLLNIYKTAMKPHGTWLLQSSNDPEILTWKSAGEQDGWIHEVTLTPSDKNEYKLLMTLQQAKS